jgi:beta-phosphoglucomutase family hydrolase
MKYRAIIFDMDGVISDTQNLHTASELVVLSELGLNFDHTAFRKRFAGFTDEDIFAQIFKENNINFTVDEAVRKKEKILYGKVNEIAAMPGLQSLLKSLKKDGVKIGLASGSSKEYIRTVLEKLDLKKYFQVVVSADEVVKGKPAPDVFLRAAELLGVRPEECVVIEDGRAGMQGARLAGMKVVALVENKNEEWPADLIVNSLMELNSNNLIDGKIINNSQAGKKVLIFFLLGDLIFLLGGLIYLLQTGIIKF